MALTPTQGQDYLLKKNIPQLMESIMIGLIHERPEDPLEYIALCVKKAKKLGGESKVEWDSFVSNVLPPITLPAHSPIFTTETPVSMINTKSPLPPIGTPVKENSTVTGSELSNYHYPFPDGNYRPLTPTAPPLTPIPPEYQAVGRLPTPPSKSPRLRQESTDSLGSISLPATPDIPKQPNLVSPTAEDSVKVNESTNAHASPASENPLTVVQTTIMVTESTSRTEVLDVDPPQVEKSSPSDQPLQSSSQEIPIHSETRENEPFTFDPSTEKPEDTLPTHEPGPPKVSVTSAPDDTKLNTQSSVDKAEQAERSNSPDERAQSSFEEQTEISHENSPPILSIFPDTGQALPSKTTDDPSENTCEPHASSKPLVQAIPELIEQSAEPISCSGERETIHDNSTDSEHIESGAVSEAQQDMVLRDETPEFQSETYPRIGPGEIRDSEPNDGPSGEEIFPPPAVHQESPVIANPDSLSISRPASVNDSFYPEPLIPETTKSISLPEPAETTPRMEQTPVIAEGNSDTPLFCEATTDENNHAETKLTTPDTTPSTDKPSPESSDPTSASEPTPANSDPEPPHDSPSNSPREVVATTSVSEPTPANPEASPIYEARSLTPGTESDPPKTPKDWPTREHETPPQVTDSSFPTHNPNITTSGTPNEISGKDGSSAEFTDWKEIEPIHNQTEEKVDSPYTHDISMAAVQDKLQSKIIVFVVGGPGSGKGTQCDKIKEKYGFTHFSSGDLLRAEVASGSEKGKELTAIMERGELVPLATVLELIKKNMIEHADHSKGFLIDGYPREVQQGIEFENTIAACSFVLWIDTSQETMVERLLQRAKTSSRADDNEETIRKRLKTFVESTEPVISYYDEQNKVRRINSEQGVEEVFEEIKVVFDNL